MLKQVILVLLGSFFLSISMAQPKNAKSYYESGLSLLNANKYPEALQAFKQAVAMNKNYDLAHVALGNLYFKGGSMDLSFAHFKQANLANPKNANALAGMGMIYRDSKKIFDSAIYYYNGAAALDSTNKENFYALAWTYNALKEYDKAIPYAVKALDLDNNYRAAYGELGHAFRATKKYNEAIAQFKKNLAISPIDVAMLYMGYCYMELNDKASALEQVEALKSINPKMSEGLKRKVDAMQ